MQIAMCSVYDSKAEAYQTPFFMPTTAMASRTFSDLVNQADHAYNKNPEDYTLFHIGEFDVFHGELLSNNAPVSLCNGLHVKDKE